MNAVLSDIRILKLVEMYERAYARFVAEMATRYTRDAAIRERLERIIAQRVANAMRVAEELARLNAELGAPDPASVERAALQDVLDVERQARDLYLSLVEEVHDAAAAALLRALTREGLDHVRATEAALSLHDRRAGEDWAKPRA